MNKILKMLAYGIGGLMLLIGSFVTYSALTGTPMHEMKAVGGMFPEEVEADVAPLDGDGAPLPEPEVERESDRRSPRQVYETASTPLGAFALSDPFSAEELRTLERRLQTKLDALALRSRELDERERQIEADRRHIDDLYADFISLKTSLIEQEAENDAASAEVARDARIVDEKRAATYREMAKLFEDTKAVDAARLLTSVYGPEEAALILTQLDDDRVRELIASIHEQLGDEGVNYVRALQKLKGGR
ncbi:MAG: hypothetical protein AAFZ87_13475 [Planctomycetota bacterium]